MTEDIRDIPQYVQANAGWCRKWGNDDLFHIVSINYILIVIEQVVSRVAQSVYCLATAVLAIRKEGVLRIFITLKNPLPCLGSSPQHLGPVASTLTTTPPRPLIFYRSLIPKKKIL
jgi:hypothetical protein